MKIKKRNSDKNRFSATGLSLIEMVIVMGLFALLGILSTRAVFMSLQGSKKGESIVKVRENLDYSLAVITRQLRSAQSVVPCPNTDTSSINYFDADGVSASFSCLGTEGSKYIASSSARLTSVDINIESCSFACVQGSAVNPPQVQIDIKASDASAQSGIYASSVDMSTKIDLRTY